MHEMKCTAYRAMVGTSMFLEAERFEVWFLFFLYFSPHQATIYKKKKSFCTVVLIVMTAELWLRRGGMSVVGSEVFVQTLS